jgi:hypothetical protein
MSAGVCKFPNLGCTESFPQTKETTQSKRERGGIVAEGQGLQVPQPTVHRILSSDRRNQSIIRVRGEIVAESHCLHVP